MRPVRFSITSSMHAALKKHLCRKDELEYAAILLCHSGEGKATTRLMAKEFIAIPGEECEKQTEQSLFWPFASYMTPKRIEIIEREGLSVVTIHSHPKGYDRFSKADNKNDGELFPSVHSWFDDARPHGSAIMMPDGRMVCRTVNADGICESMQSVCIVGADIRIDKQGKCNDDSSEYSLRVRQTFGKGTFDVLRRLKVGVVGCSGTGSIIVELLARNCIGELVLVDPDRVEAKNLNRMLNSTAKDAEQRYPKAEMLKQTIKEMGMGTRVESYVADTRNAEAVSALIDCDVLFGCVDSATGRYHLECIATAFYIPYFDIGVHLEADRRGGISHADVAAHYIYPDVAGLMAREVYSSQQLTAEGWKHDDPAHYEEQRKAGYLIAVDEDQPAVISINMLAACLSFNDFLARLHAFRLDNNADFAEQRFQLAHGYYQTKAAPSRANDPMFQKYVGMGDRSFLVQKLKQ